MDPKRQVKISKYLSLHLRHKPEKIGLSLAPGGWVSVEELLAACGRNGMPIRREELDLVVKNSDKQRFSFDEGATRIRANQGHSTRVDLQLEPKMPPAVLYHGTATKHLDSILATGLRKMSRHHVHLSMDIPTAVKVGARHGKPVIFKVDAARMHESGHIFYVSENGVWLVEEVPPSFLTPV